MLVTVSAATITHGAPVLDSGRSGTAARVRSRTVLARLAAGVAAPAPAAGHRLKRAATRARSLALHVAGLGSISWGAYEVAEPVGFVAAGVSLLVLEWLTAEEG
jgi:hypothetical protein